MQRDYRVQITANRNVIGVTQFEETAPGNLYRQLHGGTERLQMPHKNTKHNRKRGRN